MIKLIGGATIGIMVIVLGGYIASLYFVDDRGQGNSPILLGIGVILMIVGILSFVKGYLAMRSDKNLAADLELATSGNPENVSTGDGSILNKNNEMLQQWNETNAARDKLKMLEAAGAAEESS